MTCLLYIANVFSTIRSNVVRFYDIYTDLKKLMDELPLNSMDVFKKFSRQKEKLAPILEKTHRIWLG